MQKHHASRRAFQASVNCVQQIPGLKWLGYISASAYLLAEFHVEFVAYGANHDYRNRPGSWVFLDCAAGSIAIHLWHHNIQNHQFRRVTSQLVKNLGSAICFLTPVALGLLASDEEAS